MTRTPSRPRDGSPTPRLRTVRCKCHARRPYQPFQCAAHPTARKGLTGLADHWLLAGLARRSRLRRVRDEEAAGSNPATPTREWQVTRHLVACPSALRAPGCPILGAHWERTQVTEGRPQPADRKRNRRGASPRRGSSCDRQHPGTLARCMATWDMSGLKTDGATASLDRVPGLGIPAIRGAGRQDGEPGGRPGKEQKRKEEDDEQTPTPGAALGLRPPRRRSGRKGGRRAGLFTCQPRAVEDQCRLAVTAARTAAMTADNACRVWTTVEYRPNAQTTVGRSWMMCPLLRNRWSGRTS